VLTRSNYLEGGKKSDLRGKTDLQNDGIFNISVYFALMRDNLRVGTRLVMCRPEVANVIFVAAIQFEETIDTRTMSAKLFSLPLQALLLACLIVLPLSAFGQATGMQGDASWNEYRFRGQLTASGERYDPESMTAASSDLPFDSLVRVTRVDNGKTVVVRINDRTPPDEHIIHLSDAAGRHIGVSPNDTQMIRIEPLTGDKLTVVRRPEETLREREKELQRVRDDELRTERIQIRTEQRDKDSETQASRLAKNQASANESVDTPRPQPARTQPARTQPAKPRLDENRSEAKLTLQLGVFSTRKAASDFSDDVSGSWVAPVTVKGREQFRVYYDRFSIEAEARVAQQQLKGRGHDSFLRSL
jgi:rare lipoprotein A